MVHSTNKNVFKKATDLTLFYYLIGLFMNDEDTKYEEAALTELERRGYDPEQIEDDFYNVVDKFIDEEVRKGPHAASDLEITLGNI